MAEKKVVINLATGLEDAERVMVAFLVGGAALEQGRRAAMFLTKEAVRIALAEHAQGTACDGCPPLPKLDEKALVPNARLAGATPLWEWIGTDDAAVFSY
jgi:predicted peroxiredoxin